MNDGVHKDRNDDDCQHVNIAILKICLYFLDFHPFFHFIIGFNSIFSLSKVTLQINGQQDSRTDNYFQVVPSRSLLGVLFL